MLIVNDTVAVVTGASSGIGRGIAVELARRGARLALVDVDETGLRSVARELAPGAGAVTVHVTDVADEDAMRLLPEQVVAAHGRVELLVNCAGVTVAAPLDTLDLDDLRWVMAVNFQGAVHGCRYFLPHLKRASASAIVNVLSDFALIGFPTKTAYVASKFALRGFSEALRAELHGTPVSLTCAYPGPVATNIVRRSRSWDDGKKEIEAAFIERRAIPVERVARKIVDGAARGRARVLIGGETYLFDIAMRLFPALTTTMIGRLRERIPFT
jgi:short-subunit dehydrogenase